MIKKQDLTKYNDRELSLWVMNDEGFYRMRRNQKRLLEALREHFLFTEEQEADLMQTLAEERAEEERAEEESHE